MITAIVAKDVKILPVRSSLAYNAPNFSSRKVYEKGNNAIRIVMIPAGFHVSKESLYVGSAEFHKNRTPVVSKHHHQRPHLLPRRDVIEIFDHSHHMIFCLTRGYKDLLDRCFRGPSQFESCSFIDHNRGGIGRKVL